MSSFDVRSWTCGLGETESLELTGDLRQMRRGVEEKSATGG